MPSKEVVFRVHALRRMFDRGISTEEVHHVLEAGETIESYPDDSPYPSRLVLGWRGQDPLHVVAADTGAEGKVIVITAYEPDPEQWEAGFRKRRTRS